VAAVVQPAPGARASPTDVAAAVRRKLAGYKAPRRILFVDEIPRAPNGKADLARARDLTGPADATAVP
jgi:acyl-CoA synthetase (AMP-forming)/AMP-acid ligase II